MNFNDVWQMVLSIIGLLPNAFLAAVAIYYVTRRPGPDSVMLAVGTCLLLTMGLFNLVYYQIILANSGYSDPLIPHEMMRIMSTMVYFVAETFLGIGLLFLVKKELKRPSEKFGPPRI